MAKGRHSKTEGKADRRLVCRVQNLEYDFRTWTGKLYFPAGNCCDMSGAVRIFTGIDPDVRVIETFAGGSRIPSTVRLVGTPVNGPRLGDECGRQDMAVVRLPRCRETYQ